MCKMHKITSGRGCNKDYCTAYISGDELTDLITVKDAMNYIHRNAYLITKDYGYDEYDVFANQDLESNRITLNEVITELYERT